MSNPLRIPGANWVGNLTLTQSWLSNFISAPRYVLGPSWSLCYEEQFYAVTGLILAICPRWFFAGAVLTTVITLTARYRGLYVGGTFLDGYWLLFAAGIAVYWCVNYANRLGKLLVGAGFSAVSVYLLWYAPRLLAFSERRFLCSCCAFAVLLLALHVYDRRISESRYAAPLLFCGRRCYSLYLVHWPITKGLSHAAVMLGITAPWITICFVIPACVTTSIAVATVFHNLIERRFLNTREHELQACPVFPARSAVEE